MNGKEQTDLNSISQATSSNKRCKTKNVSCSFNFRNVRLTHYKQMP